MHDTLIPSLLFLYLPEGTPIGQVKLDTHYSSKNRCLKNCGIYTMELFSAMKINEITSGLRNTVSRANHSKGSASWSLLMMGTSPGHVDHLLLHLGRIEGEEG